MKTSFALLVASFLFVIHATAGEPGRIVIKLTGADGKPVPNAQVAAVLKGGDYRDATRPGEPAASDKASPSTIASSKEQEVLFICETAQDCEKIYAAAPGYEASLTKYAAPFGDKPFAVILKPSSSRGSAIVHGKGEIPGVDKAIVPAMDSLRKMYNYNDAAGRVGIGAGKSKVFVLNKPITAQAPTGKFQIWINDISGEIALMEFTQPK